MSVFGRLIPAATQLSKMNHVDKFVMKLIILSQTVDA